jgi:hypothetical protein
MEVVMDHLLPVIRVVFVRIQEEYSVPRPSSKVAITPQIIIAIIMILVTFDVGVLLLYVF